KATISSLLDTDEVDATLRDELSRLKRLLSEVTYIRLSNSSFRRVQLSRNNGNYDLVIKICELVNSALLPHEKGKGSKFLDILEDETLMWSVFQAFVMNFFKAEQSEFSVSSEYIRWDALALNAEIAQYLPVMHTDVTLRSKDRTIVIDTKYYPEALSENYGKKRIKSDHLYQLYAYLKNCKSGRSRDARQVGMRPCCEGRRLQSIRSQAMRSRVPIENRILRPNRLSQVGCRRACRSKVRSLRRLAAAGRGSPAVARRDIARRLPCWAAVSRQRAVGADGLPDRKPCHRRPRHRRRADDNPAEGNSPVEDKPEVADRLERAGSTAREPFLPASSQIISAAMGLAVRKTIPPCPLTQRRIDSGEKSARNKAHSRRGTSDQARSLWHYPTLAPPRFPASAAFRWYKPPPST